MSVQEHSAGLDWLVPVADGDAGVADNERFVVVDEEVVELRKLPTVDVVDEEEEGDVEPAGQVHRPQVF